MGRKITTELGDAELMFSRLDGIERQLAAIPRPPSAREIRESFLLAASPDRDEQHAVDLTLTDVRRWSLMRWLDAVAHDAQPKTFETEVSHAVARAIGREHDVGLRTLFVPTQVLQRDLNSATGGAGGFTAGERIAGFTPSLKASSVLQRLGAQFLGPFSGIGSVHLPGFAASSTPTWLAGQTATATQSDPTLKSLNLAPKTVSVYTKVSRQLSRQSTPQTEQLVFDDFGRLLGSAVDAGALGGDGSAGTLRGILNTTGIGVFTGTSLDYDALINGMADVANASAAVNPDSLAWITTPAVAALLKKRYRVASTDSPLWAGPLTNGAIDGERAASTASCPAASMVYGDWSQLVVAEWGILQLEADPFTDFKTGKIGLRAMWSVDVGIRHLASFTAATSIT